MNGENIIVAVISGLIPATASIIVTIMANRQTANLFGYRLDQLEKKQDKHNQIIERVYHLEERQQVTDEKIRVANHRLDDLERNE